MEGVHRKHSWSLPDGLMIQEQPDDTTCGPTCLHAIYRYYGDPISLSQVIQEVEVLDEGGTLAVMLACHALNRGYQAHIYSYNLQIFDPTWFLDGSSAHLIDKLERQAKVKDHPKLQSATAYYLEFLRKGGQLSFRDLTPKLLKHYLNQDIPILTGLSATYLYQMNRIVPLLERDDDIEGIAEGHFVILSGYQKEEKRVVITDPF